MTTMTKTTSPRIYVADLAAYNSGILHGAWIDADQDADDIRAQIQQILDSSPVADAEEYAIHDYEGFGSFSIGEYMPIDEVADLAAILAEHGLAYAAYAENVGKDYATAGGFEDAYCGEYDDKDDYAEELFDEIYLHEVPEHLRSYINYKAFGRDLFIGGNNWSARNPDGGVWVFRNI